MEESLYPFYFIKDGIKFHARPILPSDKELLQKEYCELSERSRYFRFFALQRKLSDYQLKYFTEIDGINHVAWIILDESGDAPKPVAVGRFIRLKENHETAEVAFAVVDACQRKGIGGMLLSIMNIAAAHAGIKVFRYYVLAENHFVLENLKHLGTMKETFENGIVIVDSEVRPEHKTIPNVPELQYFIIAMKQVEQLIH